MRITPLQRDGVTGIVKEAVCRRAGSQKFLCLCITHLIAESKSHAGILCENGVDADSITVSGGYKIFAADIQNRNQNAVIFHLLVGNAELLHQIKSGFLKPADIVAVMDDAHLICLVVAYGKCIRICQCRYFLSRFRTMAT